MSYLINPYILGGLPVTDVYARYDGTSFSGTTWYDISGNGRHATVSRGTVTTTTGTGNGASAVFTTLQGGTADGITFPSDVLPATYTLFHVTRYTGTTNARIVTEFNSSSNWLSGHWNNESGVAYHNGWITSNSQRKAFQNNWIISTDQNNLYRGNALTYGSSGAGSPSYVRLGINTWTSELSTWQCAEVIVYNRTLSSAEYQLVENYLNNRYGMDIYGTILPSSQFLYLDASNSSSYTGSGTVWYDISGNSRNFNIVSTAYNSSGPKYMDFNGSYGEAKNASDLSISGQVTYCLWTRIKNSSSDWRTLTRSYVSDHHVIIEAGAYRVGMYDNDSVGFIDSGYSQQSLPGWNTGVWNFMCWRWQTEKLYYSLVINDTPNIIRGSSTNASSQYNRGFGSLGGYHGGSTDPASSNSQFWGDISQFIVYNRYLTDSEVLSVYNIGKSRHGL